MIELNYGSYQHRYHPHFASSPGTWTRIEPDKVILTSDKRQALISLDLARGRTWIAGQPFDDADNITQYLDAATQMGRLSKATIGTSVGGCPLVSYLSRFEANQSLPSNDISNQQQVPKGTLVLMSRQHPPEISGEWAFDAFVAQVLSESGQAKAFRGRFQILILPVLNPDGITKGHWRTNLGLIDLNRDWGPFTQPETKAAAQVILATTRTVPAIAMIDFHSTNRDVIYAQPNSTSVFPLGLVDDWLRDWTEELGSNAPPIDRGHNPLNASSKTWGRSALGIGAITYEVGDTTSRTVAEDRAALAARLFMAKALALPDNQLSDPRLADGRQP